MAVDSPPAIGGCGEVRDPSRRWTVATPPTPARKPALSRANRPITGHSEASPSLKASRWVSTIPSPSAPTSMKRKARMPADSMDSPTRARVVSAEVRASGRPRKIVDPAIAPSKAVAAKDIEPEPPEAT
jgi:hypothetical protein